MLNKKKKQALAWIVFWSLLFTLQIYIFIKMFYFGDAGFLWIIIPLPPAMILKIIVDWKHGLYGRNDKLKKSFEFER